eukprot:8154167-Pyramimonas_sp.AAC.1
MERCFLEPAHAFAAQRARQTRSWPVSISPTEGHPPMTPGMPPKLWGTLLPGIVAQRVATCYPRPGPR